jgi:flavodoxin
MKSLVVYYSKNGSNKYLAGKVAQSIKADLEEIKPRLNLFFFLLLSSLTKISLGIKSLKHEVEGYDRIIICGPIWMGLHISPLRDFIKKYRDQIASFYLISCCGSKDAGKNDKFGYETVFQQVRETADEKCIHCEAFPIDLVIPEDKKEDDAATMNTRLSDKNFTGPIQERFETFIQMLS